MYLNEIENKMAKQITHSPFEKLAKPAQRALANAGIKTIEQISDLTEAELAQLHGIGKHAIITLKEILASRNLSFSDKNK